MTVAGVGQSTQRGPVGYAVSQTRYS